MSKVAWLVGASSGIGRALAFQLADNGWQVAISARSEDTLQTMQGQNTNLHVFPVDVTKPEILQTTFKSIESSLGKVELCFFNAGDYTPMPLVKFDTQLFRRLVEVNYMGIVNALDVVIPVMTQRQRGQILLTASLAAYRGLPKSAPYSASKAAVLNLAEALHLELKQQGVLLRVINPGFVRSPLTDKNDFKMPFLMEPEDAAATIMRKLPGKSFEIRFPLSFALIMRALSLLPYSLFFKLTRKAAQ
jgi:short-subunit dehydrogenase